MKWSNKKSFLFIVANLLFFVNIGFSADLDSRITDRPGYFRSMWQIANFYLKNRFLSKQVEEERININSHFEFLEEKRNQNSNGKMSSFFDEELQTRVYYSAIAKPLSSGQIPVVDPESKALVIYFHGSGTENGTGANFNYKGNRLSQLGYSSLSVDYPFHRDGPINSKYGSARYYMQYIQNVIQKYKIEGKPVILIGHSFGVNVISEFITQFPFSADAAILLSPVGFNKELGTWFKEKTIHMLKSFPHFVYNEMGARWAAFIDRGFTWNKLTKRRYPDPTIVNPKLKVRIVSGEWEEFIPGPLNSEGLPSKEPRTYDVLSEMKAFFSQATTVLEPGVGHLVQSHTDKNGQDLVLREVLLANGEDPSKMSEMASDISKKRKSRTSEIEQALQKQKTEPFFRSWLMHTYGSEFLIQQFNSDNTIQATSYVRRALADFKGFEEWRLDRILIDLKQKNDPFYLENNLEIDALISHANLNQRTKLINRYYAYLLENESYKHVNDLSGNVYERWKIETNWSLEDKLSFESKGKPDKPTVKDIGKKQSIFNKSCFTFYKIN